nr:hypothetical protein [uncultured bacterium]
MKTLKTIALTFALVTVISQVRADQTNFVQALQVRLQALKQGGTSTNRNVVTTSVNTEVINNRDITAALGPVTGNNFAPTARLVMVTPVGGGNSKVEVRDGNSKVDVTAFFVFEQVGAAVTQGTTNLRNGNSNHTTYSIQHLVLQDAFGSALTLHFDVRGLSIDNITRGDNGRLELNAEVSGSGDKNGAAMVLIGTVDITGGTTEVVTDEIPPGV